MMTRDEALEAASRALQSQEDWTARAAALVSYAAELRAGTTSPVLDRILDQAGKRLPPEDPTTRLTLHDIEAGVCSEHREPHSWGRIRIRDRRASSEWWMHADDQSTCA